MALFRTPLIALLALGALAAGCRRAEAAAPPRPPILLVALDSVPARLTGTVDERTSRTPVLDRLAREGLSYSACLAPEPWTYESLVGALRSAPPREFAGQRGGGPAALPTLLARAGYRTHAVLSHDCLGEAKSLVEGFETVERLGVGDPAGARAKEAVEAALRALEGADGRPPFVLLHLADARPPHHCYPGLVPETDAPYDGPARAGLPHAELLRLAPTFGPADFARVRALEASEVAAVDAALGELLEGLARQALGPTAVVAVFGTRGAWLGEGGRVGLLPGLEPEVLHVPLALVIPPVLWQDGPEGQDPLELRGIVDLPVTLYDLAPTLLDLLRLPPQPDTVGRSILPGAPASERTLHLATRRGHPMAAVYAPGAGIVRSLETQQEHLYAWTVPGAPDGSAEEAAARADLALALDAWLGPAAAAR